MPFSERLAATALAVERHLGTILDEAACAGVPERLRLAMRHAVLAGGKRLRPFLVVEAAGLFGVREEAALDVASALECVHCYSLVHDDLPAMDNDALRRGQPTVWKAFDEWTAILAGDALLTQAFEILSSPSAHADASVRGQLVLALARAAGPAGMVGGQCLDLEAERLGEIKWSRPVPMVTGLPSTVPSHRASSPSPLTGESRGGGDATGRTAASRLVQSRPAGETRGSEPGAASAGDLAHVRRLQAMKTGALITFACEAGAILGEADAHSRSALRSYGQNLGFAFQIADDLLDAEGDAGTVGKATRKDAGAGKATLVSLMGIEPARQKLAEVEAAAIDALSPFGGRAATLIDAARFVSRRER